jgi:hypothetical protein
VRARETVAAVMDGSQSPYSVISWVLAVQFPECRIHGAVIVSLEGKLPLRRQLDRNLALRQSGSHYLYVTMAQCASPTNFNVRYRTYQPELKA